MSRPVATLAAIILLLGTGCATHEDPGTDRTAPEDLGTDRTVPEDLGTDRTVPDGTGPDGPVDQDATAQSAAPESTAGGDLSGAAELSAYGLALLATPVGATHLTVTDYDAIRARLGVPELSSQDLMTDRLEFWRAAQASSVLLTDGLLREQNSRYDLTYDFTQDDVDAEAHWSGPDGPGFLLVLRPELDLGLVQAAIQDGAPGLAGAELDPSTATVRQGAGTGAVWASDPALAAVGDMPAESLIVRDGCVPFPDALGVDATVEDQDAVLAAHDVQGLLDVEAVALAFTGQRATVRLAYPEGTDPAAIEEDLTARIALGQDWPTTETIGFSDGFGAGSVVGVEASIGAVEYAVTNPGAAAALALVDLVPVGVCPQVSPLPEPTGR